MVQGNDEGNSDGSRCASSNGSGLSISFSRSNSISPLDEMSDEI